jgi:hypothetical protein
MTTSVTEQTTPVRQGDTADAAWHILSRLVVRRTGFPFDLLEELCAPAAAHAAAAAAAAAREVSTAVREAVDRIPPAVAVARAAGDRPTTRALSKVRRALATGSGTDRWEGALPEQVRDAVRRVRLANATLDAARERARAALAADDPRREAAMRAVLTDPLFLDAIFLTNPDMFEASIAPLIRSDRPVGTALARRGWAYLQRFSGKNDTASFFGPLNYASVAPEATDPVQVETVPGRWRSREVFISYWAAHAVAARISADPEVRPWLSPRPHPMSRLDGHTVLHAASGRRTALPESLAGVARLVDGSRTVRDIATALGRPVGAVLTTVERLVKLRAVLLDLDLPSTRFHPFTELRRLVAELDSGCDRRSPWSDRLAELDDLRVAFRDADLAGRRAILPRIDAWFTEVTGLPPRRGAGKTYADRTVLYEDCEGTHSRFEFSGPFMADLIDRMAPILDLSAAHASLLEAHYRRLGRRVFDDSAAGRPALAYAEFAQAMLERQREGLLPATDAAVEGLRTRLIELVRARSDGSVARLTRADLTALIDGVPVLRNCHVSPDIMIAAPDLDRVRAGDYQLVLGEVHQVVYAWGSQLYFDDARVESQLECEWHVAQMPDYDDLAVVLTERRHKGLLHESFPGTFIEVAAVPSDRARARVPISEVEVVADGDGIALRHRGTGRPYRLYMAGDEQLHLWAAALPRVMPIAAYLPEGHTPRIELDGAVYQRERWTVPADDWGAGPAGLDDAGLLEWAADLRHRHGLPRFVYLHATSEPKPYYLDFTAPLALRVVQQLAVTNDRLTFTEMLPRPEDLWIREHGQRFCGEFRMTLFRYGSRPRPTS